MGEYRRSNVFAIGDLHLSFESQKPMGIFGSEWNGHTESIERNWRRIIGEDDVVLVLGDISWALKYSQARADLEWISALPGRKLLFKGNHDLWWGGVGKLREDYPLLAFIQNDARRIGDTAFCGSRGWLCPGDPNYGLNDVKIYKRELIRLRMSLEKAKGTGAEEIIAGMHFPPMANNGLATGFTDLMDEFGVKTVAFGHLHGRDAFKKAVTGRLGGSDYRLVSADYVGFRPQRIGEIMEVKEEEV